MVPRPVLSLRRLRLFAPRLQNIPVFERGDDKSILDLKGTVRQWNETTYTVYETNMTHEYRKNVKWRFVSFDFFTLNPRPPYQLLEGTLECQGLIALALSVNCWHG